MSKTPIDIDYDKINVDSFMKMFNVGKKGFKTAVEKTHGKMTLTESGKLVNTDRYDGGTTDYKGLEKTGSEAAENFRVRYALYHALERAGADKQWIDKLELVGLSDDGAVKEGSAKPLSRRTIKKILTDFNEKQTNGAGASTDVGTKADRGDAELVDAMDPVVSAKQGGSEITEKAKDVGPTSSQEAENGTGQVVEKDNVQAVNNLLMNLDGDLPNCQPISGWEVAVLNEVFNGKFGNRFATIAGNNLNNDQAKIIVDDQVRRKTLFGQALVSLKGQREQDSGLKGIMNKLKELLKNSPDSVRKSLADAVVKYMETDDQQDFPDLDDNASKVLEKLMKFRLEEKQQDDLKARSKSAAVKIHEVVTGFDGNSQVSSVKMLTPDEADKIIARLAKKETDFGKLLEAVRKGSGGSKSGAVDMLKGFLETFSSDPVRRSLYQAIIKYVSEKASERQDPVMIENEDVENPEVGDSDAEVPPDEENVGDDVRTGAEKNKGADFFENVNSSGPSSDDDVDFLNKNVRAIAARLVLLGIKEFPRKRDAPDIINGFVASETPFGVALNDGYQDKTTRDRWLSAISEYKKDCKDGLKLALFDAIEGYLTSAHEPQ